MEKIIEISFANNELYEINSEIKKDLEEAIDHASINLAKFNIKFKNVIFYNRNFVIYLSIPDNLKYQNINVRLKGISLYLLRYSNNKDFYKNFLIGKRLLFYKDITYLNNQIDNTKDPINKNLKILKQIISLIESNKEVDKEKLSKIDKILND